jgi:Rrf2 family protein
MAWADEPVKSEYVASSVNTNPVVIRRVLCALAKARLVTSQTGAGGGSKLARSPKEITLLDVYRAVEEGKLFSLHPKPPSRECPVGVNILSVLEDVFEEVEEAVEQVLAKITMTQILHSVQPRADHIKSRVKK